MSFPDRPTAPELIEAVFEFLSGELLPTLDDHRMKFRTLVAMNALAKVLSQPSLPASRTPRRKKSPTLIQKCETPACSAKA